jgi:glycosyltransferase A (GT-A) superfamily protein (DUF2064 family)
VKTVVGVLAEPPLPGRCKPRLLAAHGPEWACGLYAAMLRDLLDGAQAIDADDWVVLASPEPSAQEALEVLVRHVPVPWKIVAQPSRERGERIRHGLETLLERGGEPARVLLFTADAPSFDTEPIAAAIAALDGDALAVAPAESGEVRALATTRVPRDLLRDVPWETPAEVETIRARCKDLGLPVRVLPAWYSVDAPSDVLRLVEELRKHPERAPRAAQFLTTHA